VRVDGDGVHPGRTLPGRQVRQRGQGLGARRHDQPALGLVLERRRESLPRQLRPQPAGEQGESEFGAGLLVGDEEVALTRAGRAAGHRPAVDQDHVQPGAGRVERAGGADHAGADDHDVTARSMRRQ
jgi:hypothetical protein